MKADAILIVGPQGSGKGTQAKILAERLGFFYWEMGGVLRENRDWRLTDGKLVGEIIDAGILLSDEQLLEVFRAKMDAIPKGRGVLFDGIPRRLGQAEYLLNALREQGKPRITTLSISLPREESLARLLKRAEVQKREDDTREGIEMRLKHYEEATVPMIEYLKKETIFIEIDGRPSIPEVTAAINAALGL